MLPSTVPRGYAYGWCEGKSTLLASLKTWP